MLKVEGLKKMYGRMAALDGLCMNIKEGALYGFVGPNGAGKTTTIKILTGLLLPDEGSVVVDGIDAMKDTGKVTEKIGYVPDFSASTTILRCGSTWSCSQPAAVFMG